MRPDHGHHHHNDDGGHDHHHHDLLHHDQHHNSPLQYDESTLSQTLVYCFAVFLISNVFPRALQMLFDLAKQQGGDYEDGDGGEF